MVNVLSNCPNCDAPMRDMNIIIVCRKCKSVMFIVSEQDEVFRKVAETITKIMEDANDA